MIESTNQLQCDICRTRGDYESLFVKKTKVEAGSGGGELNLNVGFGFLKVNICGVSPYARYFDALPSSWNHRATRFVGFLLTLGLVPVYVLAIDRSANFGRAFQLTTGLFYSIDFLRFLSTLACLAVVIWAIRFSTRKWPEERKEYLTKLESFQHVLICNRCGARVRTIV